MWLHLSHAWKLYVALLGVLGGVFGGVDGTRRVHELLFPASPSVAVMTGDINLAVADFRSITSGDNGRDAERAATALADSLERKLHDELSAGVGEEFDIQVRGPTDVGKLSGDSPRELAESARDRAAQLSAQVLVDGRMTQSADGVDLYLSVHLSAALLPGAEELVGPYELGEVAQVEGAIPLDPVPRMELRDEALGRVGALVELITALGYYREDRLDEARRHLDRVALRGDRALPDGGALLHVMRGNVALKSEQYDDAETEYGLALDARPGYARAYVGQAETAFLRAVGDSHGDCSSGQLDVQGVHEAIGLYRTAQRAAVQPPLADVVPKTDFGLGRALWCLSHGEAADEWGTAGAHFTNVVREYEAGNDRIRELAAESYAGRGLIQLTRHGDPGDQDEAVYSSALVSYDTAIATTRRAERQGVFTGWVAFIQAHLGDVDAATASYDRAATLDPDRASEYMVQRDELLENTG